MEAKIKEILLQNGITDAVKSVKGDESGAKGDGFASVRQCLTITFENEGIPCIHLFTKEHTHNPQHEKMLEDFKSFEKEARFFTEYLPVARNLCESKGLESLLNIYPKCYFGDDRLIVLENLAVGKGYTLIPNEERHDFDTAKTSLETLAKHHAIGFATIEHLGGPDKFFKKFLHLDYDGFMSELLTTVYASAFQNAVNTSLAVLKKNNVEGKDAAISKLEGFTNFSFMDMIKDALSDARVPGSPFVLNHGDYKNNNMMVLRDGTSKRIRDHVVIDLQMTRYNSPSWDIGYYLFLSVDHATRQTQLDSLLDVYMNKLLETTLQLGYPITLTKEDLMKQCRRTFKFAIWNALSQVGPAQALATSIDIDKINPKDYATVMQQLLLDWIDANPESGKEMANEIVSLLQEHNYLNL